MARYERLTDTPRGGRFFLDDFCELSQGVLMIGISKLYCGQVEPSDALRYGRHSSQLPSHLLQFSEDKKPVVVWNMTRR